MFNLRRMVTMAVVTTMTVTSIAATAGASLAAPAEKAKPELVSTITLIDSAGRHISFDTRQINAIGALTFGTENKTLAENCDSWLEVHFTVTFLGELLLRWVHRVRSCVDGINVTRLAERSQYVNTRAPSIQVGPVLNDFMVNTPPATVVTSYYQREFKYCSLDILPCLYTWQPGSFIQAVRNGQMLWQPSPWS